MGSDGNRRGPWSQLEDNLLREAVGGEDQPNWVAVSHRVGGRSAKQCRERWHQNLKPGLNNTSMSSYEANFVMNYVAAKGPRWAEISRELNNNRCDNFIKNWWNGQHNRIRRQENRQKGRDVQPAPPEGPNARSSLPSANTLSRHGLPSPTERGFSPSTREPSLAWSRDPLPPSPSSVISDQSGSSWNRHGGTPYAQHALPPIPPTRYHATHMDSQPPLPLRIPARYAPDPQHQSVMMGSHQRWETYPEPNRQGSQRWGEHEQERPQGYPDSLSTSDLRDPSYGQSSYRESSPFYRVPRSELREYDERQHYHSHQLPQRPGPHTYQNVPTSQESRDLVRNTQHEGDEPASRGRDERMSLATLMD